MNSDGLPDLVDTYVDTTLNRQLLWANGDGGPSDGFIYGPPLGHPFLNTGYTLTGDLLGNRATAAYFIVPAQYPGTIAQGPFVFSARPGVDAPNMVWAPGTGSVALDAPQWPDLMQLAGDIDGDGLLDRLNWATFQGQQPFNNLRPFDNSLWQDWTHKGYFHTLSSRRYNTHLRAGVPQPPLNRPLSTAALTHIGPHRQ